MADLSDIRSRVTLTEHQLVNVHSTDYPGQYHGEDDQWNFKKFKKGFQIIPGKSDGDVLEFDMVGVNESLANAFRRILLAEIPTMAIEKVFVRNNTSIMPDEVLAHRLGLLPIRANPKFFIFRENVGESTEESAEDTIKFELKIRCQHNTNAPKGSTDPKEIYINSNVYSKHLKWIPLGSQAEMFVGDPIRPVCDDILILKLRPGQELDLTLHCVKGLGKDHAKFSPVATAYYRLLPEIVLTKPVIGELAERLQSCFSEGVIDLEQDDKGVLHAKVVNARIDAGTREVLKYKELSDCVKLKRVRNHFIFSVESVGAIPPCDLVVEAIDILSNKCSHLLNELKSDSSLT